MRISDWSSDVCSSDLSETHALDCALWPASSLPRKGKTQPSRVLLPDEAPIPPSWRERMGAASRRPSFSLNSRLERPLLAEEVAGRMRLEALQDGKCGV